MSWIKTLFAGVAILATPVSFAQGTADVVIIGEVHDNPHHHRLQTEMLLDLSPTAVVFEMLTPEEAAKLSDVPRDVEAMRSAVAGFHWTNIADYAEILAASPVIVGAALPREAVRSAFSDGAAAVFGEGADVFGLTDALTAEEQEAREQLQFAAHCEAMPLEMMGGMVEAQRLRDAAFTRSVLEALDTHGRPVVMITGNGHARGDWGMPRYFQTARPDVTVETIGQGETDSPPPGTYAQVFFADPVDRPDPCAAFN